MAEDWARGAYMLGQMTMQLGRMAKFPPCTTSGHWIP
jgi:hypothetical protein